MEIAGKLPCLRGDRYIAPVLKDRPGFIVNRMNAPANIYIGWVFDQAKEKGFRQLNQFCWKQKGGMKSCAWVRHQDGRLYRLVPKDQD